jgi:hypothetical protein
MTELICAVIYNKFSAPPFRLSSIEIMALQSDGDKVTYCVIS